MLSKKTFFGLIVSSAAFLLISVFSSALAATAPSVITYQGKILQNGHAINNQINATFVIYDSELGGTPLYTAAGTLNNPSTISVTPINGTFSINFGGTGTNALDKTIFQNNGSLYLEVTVNNETLSPRKQITSAAYAFNASFLDGVAATSTPTSSRYIPISDSNGSFFFNAITATNTLWTNATGTSLAVNSCYGCSYFNVQKYGAVGDGVTDDAPAFQRALNDMASASGGILIVPPYLPNGRPALYAWKTPVTATFVNNFGIGFRSRWEIDGQGARIFVTSTPGNPFTALRIEGANLFIIRGLRFYGVMDPALHLTAPNAVKNVIYAQATGLHIIDSQFNGFLIETPSPNPGGLMGTNAVVYGDSITMENCVLSSNAGTGRPIIKADRWTDFRINNVTFADFYFLDNILFAPLSGGTAFSAIYVAEPLPPVGGDSIYGANRAVISNSRFDEGQGYYSIYVGAGPTYVKYVEIIGNNQNVNPANASRGIFLYKVRHALVQGNFQREGGNGSKGIGAQFVDDLVIKQNYVEANSNVRAVDFDSTVQSIKLIDSDYTTSTSNALYSYWEANGNISMPRDLLVAGFTNLTTATIRVAAIGSLSVTNSISLPINAIADAAVQNNLTITTGTIDNTPIGSTVSSTGVFTTITTTNAIWTNAFGSNLMLNGFMTVSGTMLVGTTNAPSVPYKVFIDSGNSTTPALGVNGYIQATGFITGSSTLDLAETYPIDPVCKDTGTCPEAGDVVCVASGDPAMIEKCSEEFSTKMIGVVSTKPGFALGGSNSETKRQVALAGRVPINVSLMNGPIKRGDRLTSSAIPGVAIKATMPGPTVAIALDDINGATNTTKTILGFISVNEFSLSGGWNFATSSESNTTLSAPLKNFLNLIMSLLRTVGIAIENGIMRVGQFVADHITATEIVTQKLCLDDVCVTKDELKTLLEKNQIEHPTQPTATLEPLHNDTPLPPVTNTTPESTNQQPIQTPTDTPNLSDIATPPVQPSPAEPNTP